jgi:hypothetical protein
MIDNEKPFPWNIFIRWTIATVLGLAVSDGIGFFIFPGINDFFLPGIIIASIQWWFVLRHKIDKASQWIWVTTGGWAIGLVVGGIGGAIANIIVGVVMGTVKGGESINAGSGVIGTASYLVLHGIVLGLTQWLFFLKKRFKKAGWWIFVNMLADPVAYMLFWGAFSPSNIIVTGVLVSVIRGAVFGAITGITLSWLFQQPLYKSSANVTGSNSE